MKPVSTERRTDTLLILVFLCWRQENQSNVQPYSLILRSLIRKVIGARVRGHSSLSIDRWWMIKPKVWGDWRGKAKLLKIISNFSKWRHNLRNSNWNQNQLSLSLSLKLTMKQNYEEPRLSSTDLLFFRGSEGPHVQRIPQCFNYNLICDSLPAAFPGTVVPPGDKVLCNVDWEEQSSLGGPVLWRWGCSGWRSHLERKRKARIHQTNEIRAPQVHNSTRK